MSRSRSRFLPYWRRGAVDTIGAAGKLERALASSWWDDRGALTCDFSPHRVHRRPCGSGRAGGRRRAPRWKTRGVSRASSFALEQWRADRHRRPPLHYERRFQLVCLKTGRRRYKDVHENERLHGFAADHTLAAFTAKERRADPVGALDERGKLLGNAYHPWAMAFLLGELAAELGMVEQGVDVDELVTQRIRLLPTPGNSLLSEVDQSWDGVAEDFKLEDMVRLLLQQQSARGGEIRNLQGVPRRGCAWQEIPARWFLWETVLSVPWREPGSHINVCEARARDLAVRLRARHRPLHHQRYLHLMDSQVNLNVAAKGRSGSWRLTHVQRRTAATLLAANLRDVNGFVGTKSNPADKASRNHRGWQRHRRRLAIRRTIEKAAPPSGHRRSGGARPRP